MECAEGFYRDEVTREGGSGGEMPGRQMVRDEDQKEKMEEVLKKYEFVAPKDGGALKFVGNPDDIDVPDTDDNWEGEGEERKDVADAQNSDEGADGDEEEEEEEEDEESIQRRKDLASRMQGLDIEEADFDEIWERLDSREREEFVRMAQELENEPNALLDE